MKKLFVPAIFLLSWLIFTSNFLQPSDPSINQSEFCEEILFYVRVKWLKTLTKSLFAGQTTVFFFNFQKPDKYLNDFRKIYFFPSLKLATKQKAAPCNKHILELLTNKAKQSLVYQSSLLSLKFRVKRTPALQIVS